MEPEIRVLLIEDDQDDYIVTLKLLSRISGTKYVVDWARNYDDGLEAVLKSEHDICLLDYRLGARNGLEFLREVTDKGNKTPIILLTGSIDHDVDVEASKLGASYFMIKGQVIPHLLERSIRYAVESRSVEKSRDSIPSS